MTRIRQRRRASTYLSVLEESGARPHTHDRRAILRAGSVRASARRSFDAHTLLSASYEREPRDVTPYLVRAAPVRPILRLRFVNLLKDR